MENKFKLTQAGFEQHQKELEELKGPIREKNLQDLQEARAQGDLSENADYDAARDEQARIEARIKEIENILKNAVIINENSRSKSISVGKQITVKFIKQNVEKKLKLVGPVEANPLSNQISDESPLGKALIGQKKGQIIHYKAETGKEITVEILDVK
ncbi:MAG: transcription elongation factor GreA [Candidatus Izemoplasmatales bacterium]|uniref:Transcription elongation factor GreA n=1 Tax=Hujiaoplasma nucleasis TaxID=2725268 RepID=A0A7L6N2L1_9MOLU|nr:transcription elongation factor GreA [Hujiaoplasma nucleasis]QLY39458.1 transcription elongation factor GreA [Hujiaoplasma nucleasis]